MESGKEEHSLIELEAPSDGLIGQAQILDNLTAHNAADCDQKVRQLTATLGHGTQTPIFPLSGRTGHTRRES